MKLILLLLAGLIATSASAQPYSPVKTAWQNAGYPGARPTYGRVVDLAHFGADTSGLLPCDSALAAAISDLGGAPGVVYFPSGSYLFRSQIRVNRDSLVFRGAGHDRSRLRFNLSGALSNLIQVESNATGDTSSLIAGAARGMTSVPVANAAAFSPGDWVRLSMNDSAWITSPWAYGSLSQFLQIQRIDGDTVRFYSPLRFYFPLDRKPLIRKELPRSRIGIECLGIERLDATIGQSSHIVFDRAVNCWINGIESDKANFAHVEINRSSNVELTNSYLHHAFAYGGGGQGYGVLLQFGSNECKVEANYFRHLRHSMLLQAGANGNVLAYNYSIEPYWVQPPFPDSAAGDLVLHGDYPFMNLAEGNFVRNIVIDDSHGKNGPLNTFFRNRAEGYGIFMNFSPATDSQQFIGNEITSASIGLYFLNGTGHMQYGNNYRGLITGGGSAAIPDTSLYLGAGQKPPCPASYDAWPVVGRPNGYLTGTIYAKARAMQGKPAACDCVPAATTVRSTSGASSWSIYPNPAGDYVTVSGSFIERVEVYDLSGKRVLHSVYPAAGLISIQSLAPGLYTVRIIGGGQAMSGRFLKR